MKKWGTRARRAVTARPWVSAAVAVVLVGGAIAAYALTGRSSGGSAAATTTTRTVQVATGTVRQSVSATGTLSPADEHDVSFTSAAKITSVRVAQGQKVAAGQVLGTIATVSLKAQVAQAEANLADAKSTLASAEDSSSTTSAALAADKANVTSERSALTDAQDALTDATLRAPISGTVAEVNVATGDTSAGSGSGASTSATTSTGGSTSSGTGSSGGGSSSNGSSSGTGSSSGGSASSSGSSGSGSSTGSSSSSSSSGDFVVVGMKKWTVSADLDDTEVGEIAKNDQVQLSTDTATSTFFGTVSAVSVLSSSSSGSSTYPVTIDVTGSPSGLHDGASVTAVIIYRQLGNVLTVAVDGASTYVEVDDNGKQVRTPIKVGLTSGGVTQVVSGLRAGQQVYEQVITAPTHSGSSGNTQRGTRGGYGGYGGGTGGGGGFGGGGYGGGAGGGAGGSGAGGSGAGGGTR